jgi:hypothetical protein
MTTTEVVLGIATIVLPVLTFFAGDYIAHRRNQRQQSEQRISRVLDTYLVNARALVTMGFHGLIKAGVGTLKDDHEIRTLVQRINQHGEKCPFGKHEDFLHDMDLHEFFATAQKLKYDFINQGTPECVVQKIREREKAA